jgi:hypothetical protein
VKRIPAALRRRLLRFAALAACAAAVAFSTQRLKVDAARAWTVEAERHGALEASLRLGPAEIRQAELGNAFYGELLERGIVGTERRLDWREQVARIKEAHQIADVECEFGPTQPAEIESLPPRLARHEFMSSPMTLKIAALHEQQLLDFLDGLGKSASAVLRVRACRIERLAESDASADARLKADCVVEWITLREKT